MAKFLHCKLAILVKEFYFILFYCKWASGFIFKKKRAWAELGKIVLLGFSSFGAALRDRDLMIN